MAVPGVFLVTKCQDYGLLPVKQKSIYKQQKYITRDILTLMS